jgi:acyl dehydratase
MAKKQLCWEDVKEGDEIPKLVKHPLKSQLAAWAGNIDDYNPMHFEDERAKRSGYRTVIVFGPLMVSFMEQMIWDWIAPQGWLAKITARHNGPGYPNEDMILRGKVVKKYERDGKHCVDLEIARDSPQMAGGTVGTATVFLPTKAEAMPVPEGEPFPTPGWYLMEKSLGG